MLELSLISLVVIAILTVQTQRLRQAVIYLGVLSLASSFVYLLYNAPDVAIAEAVVGSTLATVLYLVALQKYKTFTIYICHARTDLDDSVYTTHRDNQLIKRLEVFCAKQELEPQIIHTSEHLETILSKRHYALIIEETTEKLRFFGHPENYKIDALKAYLSSYVHQKKIEYIQLVDHIDGWEAEE